MFEVQIFVPMWDNDGKSFPQETFEAFEDKAREWFKGFTRCPNVVGSWVNDAGKVFEDCSRVYIVACKGLQDAYEARLLACYAKGLFSQEAIYIRYLGQSEIV